jgi:hypothetical protein
MMVTVDSSETSVEVYQITRCHIPGDSNLPLSLRQKSTERDSGFIRNVGREIFPVIAVRTPNLTFIASLRPCQEQITAVLHLYCSILLHSNFSPSLCNFHTSEAFVSSYYSDTISFGPTGCHHQVYKL